MASAGICYKLFSKISSLSPRSRFAIHPDQLGRKKKTKMRKDGGHGRGCASPNSISQKFSTVSHQAQGALWACSASSPGTPRQCLEQSCQPLPLEKAFQVWVFGLQRSKREGYFGSGLVLLAPFFSLPPAAASWFWSLCSPSSFMSLLRRWDVILFPSLCVRILVQKSRIRFVARGPPQSSANHKSTGMPEARRTHIQCTQAPSESIHPATNSFGRIIYRVACRRAAKQWPSLGQLIAQCTDMNYSNISVVYWQPSSWSLQKQLQVHRNWISLGCNSIAVKIYIYIK